MNSAAEDTTWLQATRWLIGACLLLCVLRPAPGHAGLLLTTHAPGQRPFAERFSEVVSAAERAAAQEPLEARALRLSTTVGHGASFAAHLRELEAAGQHNDAHDEKIKWAEAMADCLATVRALMADGDTRWLEVLEAVGDDYAIMDHWPLMASNVLREEAHRAWYVIALSELGLQEGLTAIREVLPVASNRSTRFIAHHALLERLIEEYGPHEAILDLLDAESPVLRRIVGFRIALIDDLTEEMRDRLLLLLLDPDPSVRSRMADIAGVAWLRPGTNQLAAGFDEPRSDVWVAALLRFLHRPDLPDHARENAFRAIRGAGYDAVPMGDGWQLKGVRPEP